MRSLPAAGRPRCCCRRKTDAPPKPLAWLGPRSRQPSTPMGACLLVCPPTCNLEPTQLSVCKGPQARGDSRSTEEPSLELRVKTEHSC